MPQRLISRLIVVSPAFVLLVAALSTLIAIDLTGTAENFLEDNYFQHQRTRGIIKTNLLVQRGYGQALDALQRQDADGYFTALDQIEGALTFLDTGIGIPAERRKAITDEIDRLLETLERLESAVAGGPPPNEESLLSLARSADGAFALLAGEDTGNWSNTNENTVVHRLKLRRVYLYHVGFCLFLVMVSTLLAATLQRRVRAEQGLKDLNAELDGRVTERTEALREANDQLKKNAALRQIILDTIPAPLYYKDDAGLYLGCNGAFEAFIGLGREKIVGHSVYDVAPPGLAEIYRKADDDLLSRGGNQVYETTVRFSDGSPHDVMFHKAVFHNEDGAPAGIVGVMLDISERKRMEEALRESGGRFRRVIDSAPLGMYLFCLEAGGTLRLTGANPAADAILGIDHGRLLGMSLEEAFPGIVGSDIPGRLLGVCREGTPWSADDFEYRHHRIRRIFEITAFQCAPGELAVFFSDVTGKKGQEEMILRIARGITPQTGDGFFRQLTCALAETLDADYAFVATLCDDGGEKVKTIAVCAQGAIADNLTFSLAGTPCQAIFDGGIFSYEKDVRAVFPEDPLLREPGIEAYVGTPLFDSIGRPLGILAVLFGRPLQNSETAESLLQIFGGLAAAELERQNSEQILQESEERFRVAFQSSPDAVLLARADNGTLVSVNDGFAAWSGYSRQECVGRTSLDMGLFEDPSFFERMKEILSGTGEISNLEARLRLRDGTITTGLVSARKIHFGGSPYLHISTRDISAIKETQQALGESEHRFFALYQQFQTLLDGIPDALLLLSPDLRVVWANSGAAIHFGRAGEDLAGLPWHTIWGTPPEEWDGCLREVFSSGEAAELMTQTADGRYWGIKVFPLREPGGTVVNVIQIASDVSEKIRLREQALQSSRLAALGILAAGVAHEINNPNAQILLNLPLVTEAVAESLPILDRYRQEHGDFTWGGLRYSKMREEIPLLLDEMEEAAGRIRFIVDDLKNFASKEPLDQSQTVDINEAVATTLRLAGHIIRRSTLHCAVDYGADLPSLPGNRQRLEQVFLNLIINACQSLPDPERGLFVTTRFDSGVNCALITIRDEGTGMSPEILSRITDPFFTTRRDVGGSGLGLSISARIVKEHGGDIRFSSAPGAGTEVIVTLPASQERIS